MSSQLRLEFEAPLGPGIVRVCVSGSGTLACERGFSISKMRPRL